MKNFNFKAALIVLGTIFLALVAVLWSWNTLAELFGWPLAQFKHAVAAAGLVFLTKLISTTKWKRGLHSDICIHDSTHKMA